MKRLIHLCKFGSNPVEVTEYEVTNEYTERYDVYKVNKPHSMWTHQTVWKRELNKRTWYAEKSMWVSKTKYDENPEYWKNLLLNEDNK